MAVLNHLLVKAEALVDQRFDISVNNDATKFGVQLSKDPIGHLISAYMVLLYSNHVPHGAINKHATYMR
jgi:hypothetical protein